MPRSHICSRSGSRERFASQCTYLRFLPSFSSFYPSFSFSIHSLLPSLLLKPPLPASFPLSFQSSLSILSPLSLSLSYSLPLLPLCPFKFSFLARFFSLPLPSYLFLPSFPYSMSPHLFHNRYLPYPPLPFSANRWRFSKMMTQLDLT